MISINNITFASAVLADEYIQINELDIIDCDLEDLVTKNSTLVESKIISPENDQHVITAYIDSDDVDYELARIELTCATEHSSGFSRSLATQLRDRWEAIEDCTFDTTISIDSETQKEYNSYIASYNQFGDLAYLPEGEISLIDFIENYTL